MRKIFGMPALLFAVMLSVACGGSGSQSSTVSPNSPSSPVSAPPSAAPQPGGSGTGATISGTVLGAAGGASLRTMGGATMTVNVVGTSLTATVDGGGNFTLNNVPAGDVTLSFSGSGANAFITITGVSVREQIHITVNVHGATADLDDDEREEADSRAEVEGTIVSINASTRTLVVGRRQTAVSVPAGTPIHHGGTAVDFSQLVVGDRVHIQAMKSGTMLTATDVEVQNDKPAQAEVSGKVSAVSGSCPKLTLTVKGTTVLTDSATRFSAACASIKVGTKVEVGGTRQAGGSILATSIRLDD